MASPVAKSAIPAVATFLVVVDDDDQQAQAQHAEGQPAPMRACHDALRMGARVASSTGDRAPARLLRDGDLDEVGPAIVAAERAFLIGG
jgi:hypothetical protein